MGDPAPNQLVAIGLVGFALLLIVVTRCSRLDNRPATIECHDLVHVYGPSDTDWPIDRACKNIARTYKTDPRKLLQDADVKLTVYGVGYQPKWCAGYPTGTCTQRVTGRVYRAEVRRDRAWRSAVVHEMTHVLLGELGHDFDDHHRVMLEQGLCGHTRMCGDTRPRVD